MKNRLYLPLVLSIVTLAAACSRPSSESGDSGNAAAPDALMDQVADVAPDTTVDVALQETSDERTTDIQADVCVPDCNGKVCGDDGCGGSCGDCMNWCDPLCDKPEVPFADPSLCMQDGTSCAQVCCPNCCSRKCGNDGCGGLCGQCEDPQENCYQGQCVCQPLCDGKQCGGDGCGGLCGQCEDPQENCYQGQCVCQPLCDGAECGDDGCGGSCGECADGWLCSPQGLCELPCVPEGGTLVPDSVALCCNGLEAVSHCHPVETGSDCDGSCPCHEESCFCSDSGTAGPGDGSAVVPAPQFDCSGCSLAVCTACGDGECGPGENACNCQPDCGYPNCWVDDWFPDSDGDGFPDVEDVCPWVFDPWQGNFDLDSLGDACDPDDDNDGTPDTMDCMRLDPSIPACHGKQCGDDGCGGSCGECDGLQEICDQGQCVCQPLCDGAECGDDSCGGSCGECADGWLCSPQGLCEL